MKIRKQAIIYKSPAQRAAHETSKQRWQQSRHQMPRSEKERSTTIEND
jgi:hypothetical protein